MVKMNSASERKMKRKFVANYKEIAISRFILQTTRVHISRFHGMEWHCSALFFTACIVFVVISHFFFFFFLLLYYYNCICIHSIFFLYLSQHICSLFGDVYYYFFVFVSYALFQFGLLCNPNPIVFFCYLMICSKV